MGEELLNVIRRVGIFIICAQTVVHFKPNHSYEKYLKLLVSIMVMVQIVFPLLQMFGGGGDRDAFAETVKQYEYAMQGEEQEIKITTVTAEEILRTQTISEINSRLNNLNNSETQEETQDQERVECHESIGGQAIQGQTEEITQVVVEQIEVD